MIGWLLAVLLLPYAGMTEEDLIIRLISSTGLGAIVGTVIGILCTWDEVMYRIFVLQKIDAGLQDADAGRMVSHEDVFKEFANSCEHLGPD